MKSLKLTNLKRNELSNVKGGASQKPKPPKRKCRCMFDGDLFNRAAKIGEAVSCPDF